MTDQLRIGSLFAGIGGFDLGFQRAGFVTSFVCEIDPAAQGVLRRQFPEAQLFSDVREVGAHNLPPVDVLTFGSPCQDLSVAGKRAGLSGERSGLFFQAIRVIQELRERYGKPTFAVWENVPGAFSSNDGADFAAVVQAMVDIGARDVCWRILDSRYFGVAQRRRRVFLVADFGGERAQQVLFESKGLRGNTPKGRKTREEVARDAGNRLESGGRKWPAKLSCTLDTLYGKSMGLDDQHALSGASMFVPVDQTTKEPFTLAIRGRGDDRVLEHRQDGTANSLLLPNGGRDGISVGAIAFAQNTRDEVRLQGGDGNIVGALAAQPGMKQTTYVAYPIISDADRAESQALTPSPDAEGRVRLRDPGLGVGSDKDPMFTLQATKPHAVAFQLNGDRDNPGVSVSEETAFCLPSNPMSDRAMAVAQGFSVHGERSSAMTSSNPDVFVARETQVTRCLDTTGGYANGQGGTIVAQPLDSADAASFDPINVTSKSNRSVVEFGRPCHTLHTAGPPHVVIRENEQVKEEQEGVLPQQPVCYSIMPQNSGKDYKAKISNVAQPLMAGGPVGGNQGGDYIVEPIPLQEVGKRTGVSTTDVRAGVGIGQQNDPMFTLQAHAQHGVAQPIAFHPTQDPIFSQDGVSHVMSSGSKGGTATVAVALASLDRQVSGTVTAKWAKGSGGFAGNETSNLTFVAPTTGYFKQDDLASTMTAQSGGLGETRNPAFVLERPVPVPMVNMQGGKGMAVAQEDGPSYTLNAMHGHDVHAIAVCARESGQGYWMADDVSGTLRAEGENRPSRPSNVVCATGEITHALTASAARYASEDGTGRGVPLAASAVQVGVDVYNQQITHDVSCTVTSATGISNGSGPKVMSALEPVRYGEHQQDTLHHETGVMSTLPSGSKSNAGHYTQTVQAMQVRRLTPTECERLQGFPDGHTLKVCLPDGTIKVQSDGPRYKQLGNAVTVNVAEWIAKRMADALHGVIEEPDLTVEESTVEIEDWEESEAWDLLDE